MPIEPIFHYSFSEFLRDITRKWRYQFARWLAPALDPNYTPRPMFQYMQEKRMFNLVGVEIGVRAAINAKRIMEMIKPAKLFLVDPFIAYANFDKSMQAAYMKEAKKRMQRYGEKVKFIMKKSSEAIRYLPLVDFVYVDGNHSYEFVKEDLKLYFGILREGGILGGHDLDANFLGVCRAVIEFGKWHNLELHGARSDYWFIKGS